MTFRQDKPDSSVADSVPTALPLQPSHEASPTNITSADSTVIQDWRQDYKRSECFLRTDGDGHSYTNHNACKEPPLSQDDKTFHDQCFQRLAEALDEVKPTTMDIFCNTLDDAVNTHKKRYTAKMEVLMHGRDSTRGDGYWAKVSVTGPKTKCDSVRNLMKRGK